MNAVFQAISSLFLKIIQEWVCGWQLAVGG